MAEGNGDVVLLIHGTAAAAKEDSGSAWWQTNSETWRYLNRRLEGAAHCSAATFHWSGANSEQERANAAAALGTIVAKFEAARQPYHLIGHSHGGSVIWQMLREKTRAGVGLPHLRSWSTLGTPFLTFAVKRVSYWSLIPLLLVVICMAAPIPAMHFYEFLPITGMWRGYVSNFGELLRDKQASAMILLPLLWLPILFALYWYFLLFVALLVHRRRADIEIKLSKTAYELFGPMHLAIWSKSDEAMNGLRSSIWVDGSLVPRWIEAKTSAIAQLASILTAPLRMVYNRILACASDEFVWDRLKQRLQGSDNANLALVRVTPFPTATYAGWHPLPDPVERELVEAVNAHAAETLSEVRAALGLAAVATTEFGAVIGRVSPALVRNLVHTSYYLCSSVRELLCMHVRSLRRGDDATNGEIDGEQEGLRSWWQEGRSGAMVLVTDPPASSDPPKRRVLPAVVACCVSAFIALAWFASAVTYRNTLGTYTEEYNINAIIPQSNRLIPALDSFEPYRAEWLAHLVMTEGLSARESALSAITDDRHDRTLRATVSVLAQAGATEQALKVANAITDKGEQADALVRVAEGAWPKKEYVTRSIALRAYALDEAGGSLGLYDLAALATALARAGENDKSDRLGRRFLAVAQKADTQWVSGLYELSKSGRFQGEIIRALNEARQKGRLGFDDQNFAAAALVCAGDTADAMQVVPTLLGGTKQHDLPVMEAMMLAHFQARCEQPEQAEASYSKAVSLARASSTVGRNLAYIALDQFLLNRRAEGTASAREALPKLMAEVEVTGPKAADELEMIAELQVQTSDWQGAAETLEKIAAQLPTMHSGERARMCELIVSLPPEDRPIEVFSSGAPDEQIFCPASLSVIGRVWAQSGNRQKAADNFAKSFRSAAETTDLFRCARIFHYLARNLERAGWTAEQQRAVAEEENAAKVIKDDNAKWEALARVAADQAHLRRYRAARQVVDNCGSSPIKVEAYTAILHSYLVQRRTSSRQILDAMRKGSTNPVL